MKGIEDIKKDLTRISTIIGPKPYNNQDLTRFQQDLTRFNKISQEWKRIKKIKERA